MVKAPMLAKTLKAEGYELLLSRSHSEIYVVMKDGRSIGEIAVQMKFVKAYSGTDIAYVPYDLDIYALDDSADMPMDLFKKMIMATLTVF